MKNLLLIFLTLLTYLSVRADNSTEFMNWLIQTQQTSKIPSFQDFDENIRTLLGDTIMFKFPQLSRLDNFTIENPDTIWIKERPAKKAKEGKHYVLSNIYKGEYVDGEVTTRTDIIQNLRFGVLGVNIYHSDLLVLTLVECENLDVVTFKVVANGTFPKFSIESTRINRNLQDIRNKKFYLDSYSSPYKNSPFFLRDGTFSYNIESEHLFRLGFNHNFDLVDTDCNMVKIPHSYLPEKAISEEEYISRQPITINSNIPESFVFGKENFPFSFEFVPASTRNSAYVKQKLEAKPKNDFYYSSCRIPEDAFLLLARKYTRGEDTFYLATYRGKAFFIKASDVMASQEGIAHLDLLELFDDTVKNNFLYHTLSLSKYRESQYLSKFAEELNSYSKYGVAIPVFSVYDESEYTDGTSVRFRVYNPTKNKTIKYITFNFVGYNAVDDPVSSRGKITMTRKGIGPIGPEEDALYEFDYVWFTDNVEYAKIKSVIVQYTDGTSKTITNISSIRFSNELTKEIYGSGNPVEELH